MRDIDVRLSVRQILNNKHQNDGNTRMFDELSILHGATRVDIGVVNGKISGFELKSAKDTLERLPYQKNIYDSVLDEITLVVADNHLKEAKEIISPWWGVMVAILDKESKVRIELEKRPTQNAHIELEKLCSFLWRDEALQILEDHDAIKGMKSKSRADLYRCLSKIVPPKKLKKEIRQALKNRKAWKADQGLQRYDD